MASSAPPWESIPALVRANAVRFGEQEALVDGEVRLSFADLERDMTSAARGMIHLGVQPGDRVAIWAPNSATWIRALLGALACGANVVPISTRFKGPEAAYLLQTSRAAALLTVDGFLGADYLAMLHRTDPELARIPTVLLDDVERDGTMTWSRFVGEGQAIADDIAEARIAAVGADDLANVVFTSGTTGRPKGAMMTHRTVMHTAGQIGDRFEVVRHERMFVVLPFFHVFGLVMQLTCALTGATCVLSSVFDPEKMVTFLEAERITVLPGPPPIFHALLAAPNRVDTDLSGLRLAFVTSTGVPGELLERLVVDGVFRSVVVGYGLTEGVVVSLSLTDEPIAVTAEWSGQVMDEVQVRVVDPDGKEVPPGEVGELVVMTPTLMQGYFDDPEATAAAFDPDGWLRTGDIGLVNPDGYVKITDRKKDMYIVGGFNAYPAEIETILGSHPDIQQAAVIGMPDERLGEVGAAFVIVRDGSALTTEEVIAWSRENMANYKVPRHVEFLGAFPLTPSLKVAKYELRDRLPMLEEEAAAAT
jgi:acyl-CoA synthetase (AMP-forming)/AMP-acid ligase II